MPGSQFNQYQDDYDDDVIDLRHYWHVVWAYKWSIFAISVVVSIITILAVLPMRPIYQSTATILIESQSLSVVSIEEVYSGGMGNWEYLPTQIEILKSRALVRRVVEKLDIRHHPDFDPDAALGDERDGGSILSTLNPINWARALLSWVRSGGEEENEPVIPTSEADKIAGIADGVAGGLDINLIMDTQLATVSFEAYDPKLTADVVNMMAEQFIEGHLEGKLEVSQKAVSWLSERLEVLRTNLGTAEQNLQEYRDKAGLVDVSGVKTISTNELAAVSDQLVAARHARTEAESIYRQIQGLGGGQQNQADNALASLPAILSQSLVAAAKAAAVEARGKVDELSKRYGPLHPKMIAAVSQLNSTEQTLSTQIDKVVAGVEQEYQRALQNEKTAQRQVERATSSVQDINRKEFRLRELERDVDTNRQLYDMFFSRAKETDQASGLEAAHARVIDPGVVPRSPIKPNRSRIVLLAFILSTFAGVLLAFLLDFLDNTIKHPGDVEERLQVPMLGTLPLEKSLSDQKSPLSVFFMEKHSVFAESIRTIRTGVILSGLDNPHHVIVVTSSVPGEGKSTVCVCLASALGQMEKTLLIDADMRRPSLAKVCKIPPNTPGLSNYVAGTAKLDDCIHQFPEGDFDLLTAGVIPSNPLEMISSRRFVEVLDVLKERYASVVIDSGPMQAVSDALILASYADALVYVVKADATPHHVARHSIQRLLHSNAPLTGVVLNHFDADKAPRYGGNYYQYGGYYDYYGHSEAESRHAENVADISQGRDKSQPA